MSGFVGRFPLPPTPGNNDVLVWDGTEFRPSRAVTVNPRFNEISSTALALAVGTGIADANRIGFLPSTATAGSESLQLFVGGVGGPTWTARGSVVDRSFSDGGNVITGTVTGTKFGTATNQKLAWWGATPVIQQSGDVGTALSTLGLVASPTIIATTNANLTGPITSLGNATSVNAQTGTGSVFVMQASPTLTSPTLVTPNIGAATGTSLSVTGSLTSTVATGTAPLVVSSSTVVGNLNVSQLLGATWAAPAAIGSTTPAAGTFTVVQGGGGSAAAPSLAFSTETTTGFYRPAPGIIGVAVSGREYFRFGGNQFTQSFNSTTLIGVSPITSVQTVTIHGSDGSQVGIAMCAYGSTPTFYGRRANGISTALTGIVSSNSMLQFVIQGYEATTPGFTTGATTYQVVATETWTSTAQGYRHHWNTTANGSTTNSFKMLLEPSGSLLLGTGTDGMTANGSIAIAQDLAHRGTKAGLFNATPIAQKTGYGTPTGNVQTANFPGATATLLQTAQELAQLLLDLKAYGIIGA